MEKFVIRHNDKKKTDNNAQTDTAEKKRLNKHNNPGNSSSLKLHKNQTRPITLSQRKKKRKMKNNGRKKIQQHYQTLKEIKEKCFAFNNIRVFFRIE